MRKVPGLLMSLAVLSGIVYFFRFHKPGFIKTIAIIFLIASLLGSLLVFLFDRQLSRK